MTGQVTGGLNNVDIFPDIIPEDDRITFQESTAPVIIPTVLSISRESLNYWSSMTCFFNKHWYPDRERVTLPFCFFHIEKYSEIQKLEKSKKRVILYEPPMNAADVAIRDPLHPGLMQTITDNVVIEPKQYKLEVIVPFTPFGRYVRQGAATMRNMLSTFITGMSADEMSPDSYAWMQSKIDESFVERAERAVIDEDTIPSIAYGNFEPTSYDSMVNKNSLDAMFERGNIVQFKTWMGQDYKYVLIESCVLEKRGDSNDVWNGELVVTEMPVLSLARVEGSVEPINRSWAKGVTDTMGELAFGRRNVSADVRAFDQTITGEETV